ncbi:MAG: DMT family transporter [Sphingomonas sp.]|uniref:DMT family transporter n=1 Tax=Sphingomonas sp. TaxID=28214 RepID=UPI0025E17E23|nr:DMT family transporter [Sphingomonas sp.]MBY0283538.1 DMT family transporter [Sphingomonas sp.]
MTSIALSATAPKQMASPVLQGVLWGGAAATIWGVYLAFARANVNTGIAPVDLAFVRYLTAGLIMLPWLLRHSPATMAGMGWRKGAMLALLAGPLFILVSATGFKFAPLSHGAVVQPAGITIAGMLLGAALLGDRLTRPRVVGAAIILAGLALVAGPSALSGGPIALLGDALFAGAGVMWAVFAVLSRRWKISPVAATAVVSVLSAAVYVPLYLASHGIGALLTQSATTILLLILIHGILSGVVAVFAFGRAAELLGAPRAAAFPALVPVVATLTGITVAGEIPAAWQIAGLLIVTFGLFVTQQTARHVMSKGEKK